MSEEPLDRFGNPLPPDPGYKEIWNADGTKPRSWEKLVLGADLSITSDEANKASVLNVSLPNPGAPIQVVASATVTLRQYGNIPTDGTLFQTREYGVYGTGLGAWSYRWDSASTATDDGVLVIKADFLTTGRFLAVMAPDGIMNALACGPAAADLGTRTKSFDPAGVVPIGSECFRITGLLATAGWNGIEFPKAGTTYRHSGAEQIASRPSGQGFYYGSKSGAVVTGNDGMNVAPMGLGAYSRGIGDTGTTATLIECDHAGSIPFNMTLNGGERTFTGFADTTGLAVDDEIMMYFGATITDFTGTGSCAILMRARIESLTGTTITTYESMPGALPTTSGTRGPQTKHSVRKMISFQDGLVISGFRFRNIFQTCQYAKTPVIDCHWDWTTFMHNHTGCDGMVIPRCTADMVTGYDSGGGSHSGVGVTLQACYSTKIGLLRIGNLDGVPMVDEELDCKGTHFESVEVNWNAINSITSTVQLFVSSGNSMTRVDHLLTWGGYYSASITPFVDIGVWEERGPDNGNGSINCSAGQANRLVFRKQGYREKQVVERVYPLTPSASGVFEIGVGGLIRNMWVNLTNVTGISYADVNGGIPGTAYPIDGLLTVANKWIQIRVASTLSVSCPNFAGYNFPGIRIDCDGTMPAGNFLHVKMEMFLPELDTPQPLSLDLSPVMLRTGSGAPSMNARWISDEYIDVVASPKKIYRAVDVGSGASDWVALS